MASTIKSIMSEDHRHCDRLFISVNDAVLANNWSSASTSLNQLIDDFNFHFDYEENILFPEVKDNLTNGPIQVMKDEHKQIRQIFDQLELSILNSNPSEYFGIYETLSIFIQQHNIKEENILYPMIDTHSNITDSLVTSTEKCLKSRDNQQ